MAIAPRDRFITVARHGIEIQHNGLSRFQNRLLDSPSPVRLGEAPTGSGKTFAFIRSVDKGSRVLFIVPTRRLGQNLVQCLGEDLLQLGWTPSAINKKIALWTSDGRQMMIDQGVRNITQKRLVDITRLAISAGGEFVIATPESVAWLVLDPSRFPVSGVTDRSVLNILVDFDHIVFDEMHTIDAKGLSQGLILSRLAKLNPQWQCRVSFLSATPVDFLEAMGRFGIASDDIEIIQGDIQSSPTSNMSNLRIIHGDVNIHLATGKTIPDLLHEHLSKVLDEIQNGYSVILIYDELYGRFSQDLNRIDAILTGAGIAPQERLLISSADDSASDTPGHPRFCSGRNKEPGAYKLLVCTSSVEIGVTYKTRMTLMEPGYSSASFQQRLGRVARQDTPGEIFVVVNQLALVRHPWLRDLQDFMAAHQGQSIPVDALSDVLTRDTARRFSASGHDAASLWQQTGQQTEPQKKWFDRIPGRAAAIGGLAWCLMMEHHSVKNQRKTYLLTATPAIARQMYASLTPIRMLGEDCRYDQCVNHWFESFRQCVLNYRETGKQIKIINPAGKNCTLSLKGVINNTSILDRFDLEIDERGEYRAYIDHHYWRDYVINKQGAYREDVYLQWPHTDQVTKVPRGHSLKQTAISTLRAERKKHTRNENVLSALAGLEQIVAQTGLVVCSDVMP